MAQAKLNLPPDYKKRPEYFDAFNVDETTPAKNAVIEKLLKEQNVKTVLDMTCGTGSQVFHLLKHGYGVTGSDFSSGLLNIAREKARNENIEVKFIDGDMRTLKIGKFDAVITIFNAVGHLTKAGFEKAMRNIHKNLKDGGIYVFDIFNLAALTDEAVTNFAMDFHRTVGDVHIHATQYSMLDRKKGRLTSYNQDSIQANGLVPTLSKSKFTLQIYTACELKEMLGRNGFETIGQYDMEGSPFQADKSLNILMVARKNR